MERFTEVEPRSTSISREFLKISPPPWNESCFHGLRARARSTPSWGRGPVAAMTQKIQPDAVVYPGAPLRAVAIEVRFPALLDAFSRFGAFQRRHAAAFDRVYETSEDKRHTLPDGREFERPRTAVLMGRERDRAVSLANDQLTVITYPYTAGFKGFLSWAMPMLREGLEDLGVEQVTGVSFRYENRIKHDTYNLDLASVLKLSLAAPPEARGMQHAHLYWHQVWPDGVVEVDLEACPQVSEEEIHLNITAYRSSRSKPMDDEMESMVREAHRMARLTFEELIAPSFRATLGKTT
jgi:uncharacterized protein (TIGR04255 family)